MENKSWEFSPYIIGHSQFPDESGPEYFVQDSRTGKILSYHEYYDDAYKNAVRLKNASES